MKQFYPFDPAYVAEKDRPFRKPIYDASIEERLADLKKAIEMVESMFRAKEMIRPYGVEHREGLKDGEFAIGDWIVRPRFK